MCPMANIDYKAVFDKGIGQLKTLMERREKLEIERDNLEWEISLSRQLVEAVAVYCAENPHLEYPELFPGQNSRWGPASEVGFTDGIRKVLATTAPGWITAVMIRTALPKAGYEIESKNILPSIHTVLKRLVEKKEVESKSEEGRLWYRWNLPVPTTRTLPDYLQPMDWIKFLKEDAENLPTLPEKSTRRRRKS
jgi:hypothetical protein